MEVFFILPLLSFAPRLIGVEVGDAGAEGGMGAAEEHVELTGPGVAKVA